MGDIRVTHPTDVMMITGDIGTDVSLCGHTHSGGEAQIRPNLHVINGPAEYGLPVVQQVFAL
jgi:hypothetical protein